MSKEIIDNLGPLAPLVGRWEGAEGVDIAPSAAGAVETRYRESLLFEPLGPVENGPQTLYGLRYSTTAWPLDADDPFHEECGYWLWDANAGQVMRCFMVPRGVTILAGGSAEADSRSFSMAADVGSEIFGILSNPFLDLAFKTVRYELNVHIRDADHFSYVEDTQLQIQKQKPLFHHTDSNALTRLH